jgi:hypothetical protein
VQGQWCANNLLNSEEIPDIDASKSKQRKNDMKFIQKLQHFARCVPGSYVYWRNKQAELLSWIGHHVEEGNGVPSLFVTSSCAEYHWKYIDKLCNARRKLIMHV